VRPLSGSVKKVSAKKIMGAVMLGLGALFFVLCIIPSFLGIGRFFLGLFGIMAYPMFLLLALVGLALVMNLTYTFNKKFTAFIVIAAISILCLLHTIFTSSILLERTKDFGDFGAYLNACYGMKPSITVGGAFLGIFVYLFRALIGLGATYVVFAVVATVFVGLVIDYIIYNKKHGHEIKLIEKSERAPSLNALDTNDGELFSFSSRKPDESFETQEEMSSNPPIFETSSEKEPDFIEKTPDFSGFSELEPKQDDEKARAKSLLFGNSQDTASPAESDDSRPKSAREVLFGDRSAAIPNVFDRSAEERNDWRRQYASKTLQFREENEPPKPIENVENEPQSFASSEPIFAPKEENDGLVRTSWGTYRPTRSSENNVENVERPNPLQRTSSSENIFERRESLREVRREEQAPLERRATLERDRMEPVDNSLGITAREPLSNLGSSNRNTISDINKNTNAEDNHENADFGSRLSRVDRRVRGDDLLSEASSLGISQKEQQKERVNPFVQSVSQEPVRETNRVENKPKVEKMSFTNQLNRAYKAPPTSLLKIIKEEAKDYSLEYKHKSEILEATLETFKIPAKVINVVRGPKVTRYELSMPTGIPVSRVLSYEKDMSMNLAAKNGIRIEAPIPGKNAFGVEVANDMTSMVGFRELVESPEFVNFKGALPVAIGKNISGEVIIKSLPKMVHCLVAGSTGSGKSVFLHSLIMSLMFKHSPDELRFIMIDPKRVEFSRYNRMPHLMLPEVVTDCSKAVNALNWAVKEMERRFQLLMDNECQKIDQYNALDKVKKGEEKRLPFLILVVDELAELMGVAKKDVEGKIQRITQLGRACGIHMVVATQRPSVDVVTGVIKNNMPTRIAFSLSSYVDSKTILDEAGAEKLLGQGDMLFSGQDSNQKIRLQGAFVSDEEIKAVLDYIKANNISEYDEEVQNSIYAEPEKEEQFDDDDDRGGSPEDRMDEYMPQALKLVMKNGKASISMIQRRFCVGYARAARIIDQMETRGFIDAGIGNKPRDVKITVSEYNELFGDFDGE